MITKGQNCVFTMRLEPGTKLGSKRNYPFGHGIEGGKTPTDANYDRDHE